MGLICFAPHYVVVKLKHLLHSNDYIAGQSAFYDGLCVVVIGIDTDAVEASGMQQVLPVNEERPTAFRVTGLNATIEIAEPLGAGLVMNIRQGQADIPLVFFHKKRSDICLVGHQIQK